MFIITSKSFDKKFKKLSNKIQSQVKERTILFKSDPFDSRLNNHILHGEMKMIRSINITGDLRILYEEIDDDSVRFIDIDTHSNLY